MGASIVTAVIDRDKNFIIQGRYEFQRAAALQEGILVPPNGTAFPTVGVEAHELFYRSDQQILYLRNPANTAWLPVGSGGDVTAAAAIPDNALVRGDGGAKDVQGSGLVLDDNDRLQGVYRHAPSATDPVAPTPVDGDAYYNTALGMEMRYDASRSKWLSVESVIFQCGRRGNTPAGAYYRGINGLTLSATKGYPALFNGTVVAAGYTRTDTDSMSFEITANAVTIASGPSSATSAVATNMNADFNQADALALRNGGPNPTSNVQAWIRLKWRV